MLKIKRYQLFTRDGIVWSKWFVWNGTIEEKWQLKNKLKNEYKEITSDEWPEIQQQ